MFKIMCYTDKGFIEKDSNTLYHIPDTLIHISPIDRKDSIIQNGLILGSKRTSTEGKIRGIYLAKSLDILQDDAAGDFYNKEFAIFEVDIRDLKDKLRPDPEWRPSDHNDPRHYEDDMCWFIEQNVSPLLLKYVGTFSK